MASARHICGMFFLAITASACALSAPARPPASPAIASQIENLYAQRLQGGTTTGEVEKIFQNDGLPTNAMVGEKAATDFIVLLADTPADFLGQMIGVVRGAADSGTIWPDAYPLLRARLAQKDMIQMSDRQKPSFPDAIGPIEQLVHLDQEAFSRPDADPKQVAALLEEVRRGIQGIMQQYGLPNYATVGVRGTEDFFSLLNHQSNRVLSSILPNLQNVLNNGEGNPQVFATLFDRMQQNDGDAQTYGTQIVCNKQGQLVPWKITGMKHLDHRRALLGLEPERCYLDESLRHAQPCKTMAAR